MKLHLISQFLRNHLFLFLFQVLIDHKTILTSKCIEALDPIYVISDILRYLVMLKVASSQNFVHFGSNLQKKVTNHFPEHLLAGHCSWKIFDTFFGDLSQDEKLSEIKPPL